MSFIKTFRQFEVLIKNTSWLVGAEVAAKASRLCVIFTLAAALSPTDYGVVMLALASHEIFKLVQRSGAGAQIIQCEDTQLKRFIETGKFIQWILGIGLFVLQCGASFLLASVFDKPDLIPLLSGMAVVYLVYPFVSIQVFLSQRGNQLRAFSVKNALCIIAENLSIAVFVMVDAGISAVVYAKWVFAVFWVGMFFRTQYAIPKAKLCISTLVYLFQSSAKILVAEFSRAIKNQADMFFGAKFLSPEAFGIYSFAKTAGVNLGQSLSFAFNAAVYPYLCEQRRKLTNASSSSIYFLCGCLSLCFLMQALSVEFYVPMLFVQQWQQEYTTISLLCLANIPITLIDTLCNQYRANAQYKTESGLRVFSLIVTLLFYLLWSYGVGASGGFYHHAVGLLTVNVILLTVFLFPLYSRSKNTASHMLKEQ